MKLADLEQRVIVPITDQTKGGIQYEVEISIEELLKRSLEDFEPILVDAIPVEWLREKINGNNFVIGRAARFMLHAWKQEQEAR